MLRGIVLRLRLRGMGGLRLGGGAEAPRLRGRVVVLRLQEILGWCCWGMGVGCCG